MSDAKPEAVPEDSLDNEQLDSVAGGGGHQFENAEFHEIEK